ncbi:unnamed protein product [Penicillium salamii]|uniref:C2H2-type domain-containing protein n=1 Tax=Penicillium salamii TaxID=1612424 RepID=A0A9W4JHW3_9EURO|nr:unnamed protein product [Penicillium salamii]
MASPNQNPHNPEHEYQFSHAELKYWEATQTFPMYSLHDLSVPAPLRVARNPSYHYGVPLPPTPAFERMLSPAPSPASSNCYLDHSPAKGYLNQGHLAPTSAGVAGLPSAHYDPRCPSPWTDTASPVPSSTFLNPHPNSHPIKRPIEEEYTSFSDHDSGAALTPASICDPSSSPWAEAMPLPTPEKPNNDNKASESPTGKKKPCQRRSRASKHKKSENKDYGTYRCEYEGCTYDRFFSRKGVLKRHIQTQHLYPRAFKCPHPPCEHASSRRENMKAHRQSVHKETVL